MKSGLSQGVEKGPNVTSKKWKIVGLEKALESIPEADRAALAEELKRTFADFDPENAPGEPVPTLPPGTRSCSTCGGKLVELGLIQGRNPDDASVCVLECEECDATFCEQAGGKLH